MRPCIHYYFLLQRGSQAMWDRAQEDTQLWSLEVVVYGVCSVWQMELLSRG